jgi:protein dithiol oxidoreductase (disulfide-forming)
LEACLKRISQIAALAVALSLPGAYAANWEQGVHYRELAEPQPVQTGEQIEVRELFWYGCPHCYTLEPYIENWIRNKPEQAEYLPVPGIFHSQSEFHARAFYTFEALGITEDVHRDFYDELHQRGNRIYNLEGLTEFAARHDVDADELRNAFDSFSVDANVRNANQMFRKYGATGVPTIIVDGRYLVTVSSAGGHEQLMELINFLVDKAAGERSD